MELSLFPICFFIVLSFISGTSICSSNIQLLLYICVHSWSSYENNSSWKPKISSWQVSKYIIFQYFLSNIVINKVNIVFYAQNLLYYMCKSFKLEVLVGQLVQSPFDINFPWSLAYIRKLAFGSPWGTILFPVCLRSLTKLHRHSPLRLSIPFLV